MRDLPLALRWYLWAIYLACPGLIVVQVCPLVLGASPARWPSALLGQALVFVVLGCIAEGISLRRRDSIVLSLDTVVHVAAILLFPPPLPLVVAFVTVLVAQAAQRHKPLHKRAFNVCHATLVVGLCSLVFVRMAAPLDILRPGPSMGAIPAVIAPVFLYYVLDVGVLLGVLCLLDGQPLHVVWWQRKRATLWPELAAATNGVLTAMVWRYDPLMLGLLALPPVIALRVAFRAIGQAQERAGVLRQVLATGQHLRLQRSAADLLHPVAEAARALLGASTVAAYLHDGDDPARLQRVVLVPHDAPAASPPYLAVPARGAGIHAEGGVQGCTLRVPLELEGGGVAGLLHVNGVRPRLAHDARDALAILATQAAIALENVRLHERALAQASEDGLTGLLNHRAFQTRLAEEVARAQRGGHALALLMIDLDDFGAINNVYGHQAGDATLVAIATVLREGRRVADVLARYGGDELAVILPDTTIEVAVAIAERLRAAITALTVVERSATISLSASVGVAALPLHAGTCEDLIRAADQAAYAAKHAGKGRVCRPEDAALLGTHDPAVLAAQLADANLATVEALAAAVDAKDAYTRGHSQRVSAYAAAVAAALGLPAGDVARVRLAGLLHDVGKIGVPDAILTKPGHLSEEEFTTITQHPALGARMLAAVPFLREILPAVRHHHERWDGRGYPDGLAGATIPRDAAILAVADAFDAMTSSRTYRGALPLHEAQRRVREASGTQFDPRVVAAFEQALADGALVPLCAEGSGPYLADVRQAS